jgi:hypothetical protein
MAKRFKVFGVGLNKTGTSSLGRALSTLGYRHLRRQPRFFRWCQKGRFRDIFEEIAPFEAFEDWPWPLMYREIYAEYGDQARYILTRRKSPEIWVKSLKKHSLRTNPDQNPRRKIYGFDYPHGAEEQHCSFYDAHLKDVRSFFAEVGRPDLLCELCWDDGDGWKELCEFLGEGVPSVPFPHVNKSAETTVPEDKMAANLARIDAQLSALTGKAAG